VAAPTYVSGPSNTVVRGLYPTASRFGYGEEGVVIGEEIVNVPVRVPVYERRVNHQAAPVIVEKAVHVPYPVEHVVSQLQYVPVVQYVHVPTIEFVEKPVVQIVEKLVVQYVDKPVVEYIEKIVPKVEYVDKIIEKFVYSCAGCGGEIRGEMFEALNRRWHRECFITCAGCGGWIAFDVFSALNATWHFGCFTCFKCGKTCGNDQWVLHEGKVHHQVCIKQEPPGVAMRQTISVGTLAEAERLDAMDGVIDGKYNGTAINCPDPEWQRRWAGVAAWEVSDERMAAHLDGSGSGNFDGKTDDGSRIVVSRDGKVDGNV